MFGHVPFSYSYDSEWLCIVEQPLAWPGDGGGPKGRGTQRGMGEVKKKEEKWTILHMSIRTLGEVKIQKVVHQYIMF